MTLLKRRTISLFFTLAFILAAVPVLVSAASPFKDVKTNHWAYPSIEWAYNQGVTNGYPNGTFEPDRTITEAQFVDMLIRFDCSAADSVKASATSKYRYLQNKKMPLNGYSNLKVRDLPITKGQVARIAAAFQGLDLSESRAVQYMYTNDLANGATGKNDYQDYQANLSMTRADTVVFLNRLSEAGNCEMIGLNKQATGSDNQKVPLPPSFMGSGTVTFNPPPKVNTQTPVVTQPTSPTTTVAGVAVDIDKPILIANGIDTTFVTVSLKGCTGSTIDYTDSLSFTAKSVLGAKIDSGQTNFVPKYNLAEAILRANAAETQLAAAIKDVDAALTNLKYWQTVLGSGGGTAQDVTRAQARLAETERLATIAETQVADAHAYLEAARAESDNRPSGTSAVNMTDGPDIVVRVTAPRSSHFRTDTLIFQLNDRVNTDCYSKPIAVNLHYAPQAELRLEMVTDNTTSIGAIPADGSTALIKATIVGPDGYTLTNYNGQVHFRSSQGALLSNDYAWFSNGVALTTVKSLSTTYSILDEITAELDYIDPRYKNELSSLSNTTHGIDVLYEPKLQMDTSCTSSVPEVAFIIDSSGSMRGSDPTYLRVTKSQEFIKALNAPRNIASHFNSSGKLLHPYADTVAMVEPTFIKVGQSGGTNIASGLRIAFDKFTPGNAPKIAILLTDGKSNEQQTLNLLAEAKQKNIKIYTIGLGNKNQLNETLLLRLSQETGGHYFHASKNIDLGAAYQSILSAVTCDIPAGPTCMLTSQVFTSPTLETVGNDFFMNTYANDSCGQITRVVLRFNSSDGNIDYELAHRNQGYYALQKGTYEINNFHLLQEGVFLAYNAKGELVSEKRVQMRRR